MNWGALCFTVFATATALLAVFWAYDIRDALAQQATALDLIAEYQGLAPAEPTTCEVCGLDDAHRAWCRLVEHEAECGCTLCLGDA